MPSLRSGWETELADSEIAWIQTNVRLSLLELTVQPFSNYEHSVHESLIACSVMVRRQGILILH